MCRSVQPKLEKMPLLSTFVKIIIFLIFVTAGYLVVSFQPLTKEEHVESFDKMDEFVEPFHKNLSQCAHKFKASAEDVQNFLNRKPQTTLEGKCVVACILMKNGIIIKNKITRDTIINMNKKLYGENSKVLDEVVKAVDGCILSVSDIFEVCEYASSFNDCMHVKMAHALNDAVMERRMEALGQAHDPDDEYEDEMLRMTRDEL